MHILPTTFSCVDITVDGNKVGGESATCMTIDDDDERACQGQILVFVKEKGLGDENFALPQVPMSLFVAL